MRIASTSKHNMQSPKLTIHIIRMPPLYIKYIEDVPTIYRSSYLFMQLAQSQTFVIYPVRAIVGPPKIVDCLVLNISNWVDSTAMSVLAAFALLIIGAT